MSVAGGRDERTEAAGVLHDDDQERTPLYWRLLRLHHVRPNGWQRALLVEGVFALAALLTLADVASAWTLIALPVAVAAVVKLNDIVAGLLAPHRDAPTSAADAPDPDDGRGADRPAESPPAGAPDGEQGPAADVGAAPPAGDRPSPRQDAATTQASSIRPP